MPVFTLTFPHNQHAWAKIVGIHHYAPVFPPLGRAMPLTLTHNPNNHVHGSAIEVSCTANGVMVGHLRYQVADLMQLILAHGWTMSAVTTGAKATALERQQRPGFS